VPDILDTGVIDEVVKDPEPDGAGDGAPAGPRRGCARRHLLGRGYRCRTGCARRPEMAGKTSSSSCPPFAERYISSLLFEGL
jgi:hypothetical protein